MSRLPVVGEQPWAPVFLDWLQVSHNDDGTLKGVAQKKAVRDFGNGVGQGSAAVDTAAFQAAAIAAIAEQVPLVLPPSLILNSTITLQPPAGNDHFKLDIEAEGDWTALRWTGGSNTSIFKSYGWKRSEISGVKALIQSAIPNVVVWDVDHDSTRGSTGVLDWYGCEVTVDPVATGCVGWRLGHTAGTELSFIRWFGCGVGGGTGSSGLLGWVNEDLNGLVLSWYGCGASFCSQGWSNSSTAGAAHSFGGPTLFLYGCGGSYNDIDLDFVNAGIYGVYGGRWEVGKRFLNSPWAQSPAMVTISGVELGSYAPSDGIMFYYAKPGVLTLDNLAVANIGGSDYTSAMIRTETFDATRIGTVRVLGGAYQAADPFFSDTQGTKAIVTVEGAKKTNNTGIQTGMFAERVRPDAARFLQKAGAPTDADFPATPPNGTMAIDTTNNKIMVRIGGVWKGVTVA